MANHIERMTTEELVESLYNEDININELSFMTVAQRDAFIEVLKRRPSLLSKVNDGNADVFFKYALENNYEYFVYLKPEQYTNSLAQLFLHSRLTEQGNDTYKNSGIMFNVGKSLDDCVILSCTYSTPDGEELFFNDKDLQVPVGLKSSYKFALKLTDAVKLIKKLDTHITLLGKNKIESTIEDIVGNLYKTYLNDYIKYNSIGFYSITTSYSDIETGFLAKINNVVQEYGFTATSFVIKAIAIPKDIQYKIEDQAFEIRRRLADAEADSQLSKKSLEDYEAKLEIQNKYPDVPHTLTEYEKDLALRRYLIRTGKNKRSEIDHNIEIARTKDAVDEEINKEKDVVPEVIPSKFKVTFFSWLVIVAIFTVIMLAVAPVFGVVCLIGATIIFTVVGVMNADKLAASTPEVPQSSEEDTDNL